MLKILLLVIFGLVGVLIITLALIWWLLSENSGEPSPAEEQMGLTQMLIARAESNRIWRAVSSWLAEKPPQIQHRRDQD